MPSEHPGCFGAASVFARDSDACKRCEAFAQCDTAVTATLQALSSMIDVSALLKRHDTARAAGIKAKPLAPVALMGKPEPAPADAKAKPKSRASVRKPAPAATEPVVSPKPATGSAREIALAKLAQRQQENA